MEIIRKIWYNGGASITMGLLLAGLFWAAVTRWPQHLEWVVLALAILGVVVILVDVWWAHRKNRHE